MLDGGFMGEKLALQSNRGETSFPRGFYTAVDSRHKLVKFLESHRDEFATIHSETSLKEFKKLIAQNKYGVCVTGEENEQYYTLTESGCLCSFYIEELKPNLYWMLNENEGAEWIDYFKIKPGSYQLEKVME